MRRRKLAFGPQAQRQRGPPQKAGEELQFTVHDLAAVSLDGRVISSTRIREATSRR